MIFHKSKMSKKEKGAYYIDVICYSHGIFRTNYYDLLKGHNCPKCAKENTRIKNENKLKDYLQNKYKENIQFPNDFYYHNSYTPVKIIYKNEIFLRTPHVLFKKVLLTKEEK